MKRHIAIILTAVLAACPLLYAQDYVSRYNNLISRVGCDGLGVDGLLTAWEKADSNDVNLLLARFNYWYARSERDSIVVLDVSRHLGEKPVLQLRDSSGRARNYFREKFYDDTCFGQAIQYIDKAYSKDNMRLDIACAKVEALMSYEKGSPDLALESILRIIGNNFVRKYKWESPGSKVDAEFFDSMIQDLAVGFYRKGEKGTYEAFRKVSESMLRYEPSNTTFLDNMGAYWLVAADKPKTARKFYQKSLKIDPSDEVAKTNMSIIGKKLGAAKAKNGR